MMRAATLLWAMMAAIAGTGLFLLKYQVQAEERHLRELRKDIAGSQQAIHVLKAEWSYLNDPARLREQAERHLDMRPMRANQIVTIESIPLVGEPLYLPPGLIMVKNGVGTPHRHDEKSGAKPVPPAVKPPHKPIIGGKIMTASGAKPKPKPRSPEVASARIRP